jgi:glycosyltransferase involved in cell wall biosynthesis
MVKESLPISVVTACRNCDNYVGNTILSVIGQQYQNLQYIVVDGASTDSTLEIVNRYRKNIDTIISEPDNGQYYGIQKGMELAHGEIMAWLNADDIYYPWTFSVVQSVFEKYPEVEWLTGVPSYINDAGQCIRVAGNPGSAYPRQYIRNGFFRSSLAGYLQQESMFWRRSLWEKVTRLDLSLKYAADFELWTRFAEHAELYSLTVPLAAFRTRPGAQISSLRKDEYEKEVSQVCRNLKRSPRLWAAIAGRGVIANHICRMLIWKKCKIIVYSEERKDWIIKKAIRPLSRLSLAQAMIEMK